MTLQNRCDQPEALVGDHQPDSTQAPFAHRAQERAPRRFALAVADHHTQTFAVAVLGDAGGEDHRPRDDLVIDAGLAAGRVEVDGPGRCVGAAPAAWEEGARP